MERAGSLIGKLKLSPETADPETRARAAWGLAAGKKIAAHTLASALVRGTLVVEVEDMVWQKQLNTLRHFLLRNLKEALGGDVVWASAHDPFVAGEAMRMLCCGSAVQRPPPQQHHGKGQW